MKATSSIGKVTISKEAQTIEDNLRSIINTLDGSKVYYSYQEAYEKDLEEFDTEGLNSLPQSLNDLALLQTILFLCNNPETHILRGTRFEGLLYESLSLWEYQVALDVMSKHSNLYSKYETLTVLLGGN